ncbi:MAG: HIT family protein [Gaiellaceae bacterium]
MSLSDCIFCRIVAAQAERSLVYEDGETVAFMDIAPITPGHTLIVPKTHASMLADLDEADGARLFVVGQRVAAALYHSQLRCEGINFHLADGEVAGQDVFHVHLHVIPRFAGDPLRIRREGGLQIEERAELDRAAAQIAGALP